LGAALLLALSLPTGVANAHERDNTAATLRNLRRATAQYHSVPRAERAGYEAFLECFDSDAGGMGQHYVNFALLDGEVDALQPEAMVYEVTAHGLDLVAVEYIVPGDLVDPADPPELFGHDFHLNAALGVWVLHAWVWKHNPSGIFADYNPAVIACP
jgi:hypothetical protein